MPGVIAPQTKEEAASFLDMLEKLIASVKGLVNTAVDARRIADTFVAGRPHNASTQRAADRAEKSAQAAKEVAWQRVRFAERNIVNKTTAIAATAVFLEFVTADLGWDEQTYIDYLQGMVKDVFDLRDAMETSVPEEEHTYTHYYISAGGPRLKRGRYGGSSYDFDEMDLEWLAAAPYGEGYLRRSRLQQKYGCGHTAVNAALRKYKLDVCAEDLGMDVDDEEFCYHRVHYDEDGNVLREESEDRIAEMVAAVRMGNRGLGAFNMTRELRLRFPGIYFSKYRICKVLQHRDLSARVRWAPILVRGNLWSPYPGFCFHMDGVRILVFSSYPFLLK